MFPLTLSPLPVQHYQKDIRDLNQPLLVCRPRERDIRVGRTDNLYLIPELCFLTGEGAFVLGQCLPSCLIAPVA